MSFADRGSNLVTWRSQWREPGFRNPKPVESRIIGFGIWNVTNDWSPESKFLYQRLEFGALKPETMEWNLESETILDFLTFEWSTRIIREIFFGTSIAGFNFPLKTNVLSWSQNICSSYFHPLSPTPSWDQLPIPCYLSQCWLNALYTVKDPMDARGGFFFLVFLRVQEGGTFNR